MKKESLRIKGMTCASCAQVIVISLKKNEFINSADVNFATKKATFEYDKNNLNIEDIKNIIIKTGYQINDTEEASAEVEENDEKWLFAKVIGAIVLTLPIFVRMFWMWEIPGTFLGTSLTSWVQHDLSFIVVFIFGWQFHRNAFKALLKKRADMDTLISVGTLSAYFYSLWAMFNGGHLYFESAATIASLILLGRYMEMKTKNKASRAMEKLMELGVKKARVIRMGEEMEIDIDDVVVGDHILIKPGEKIPLDGVVIEGISNIDESMLTGESMPITKELHAQVYGATMNLNGVLKIKVTKGRNETMLAQIIQTVEEAQNYKAPMQKLADKIASIFVPVVISIALLTFLGWFLATGNLERSLINAVAVLIISCPCALGIATPIAIMIGTSVGAKNGILIKNGESFEKAKNIDTIVFDKTGTLTVGKPIVQRILSNDAKEEQLIKVGASLATNSEHPLSKAIVEYSKDKNIELATMENFKEYTGLGISANCKTHKEKLFLGNIKILKENNLDTSWANSILESNKETGETINFVSHGEKVIGAFFISDEIKETAVETIKQTTKINLHSIMLTGDNRTAAAVVAKKIGIKEYLAEVLPTEKQNEIKKLQGNNKKVVFVGDGINDAPALVQADLGIAMGSGSDIAKESGDIIIIKSDPLKVIEAVKLSRKTFNIIKQNLFWAFFYNILAIPLAVFGFVNPMLGALAMGFSDVTIITNSLRIYRNKK
ncbi:MAG: heavy metal translocating P-type ATPase [Patescibacteria group bacterium]|jgi:Cu+-exporting ATPase|nr:heavy metal translocating P-type ATPase [Patescibacteria group bacterium]